MEKIRCRIYSCIYIVYCWDTESLSFITDHKFFSLTLDQLLVIRAPKNSPRIWRLGTKWLFGHHPTAMGAYLDAWRLKPEPNLEWLVFLVGTFQLDHPLPPPHRHVEKRHYLQKEQQKNSLFTPWNPTCIYSESTRRSDTIRLSWWVQVCFFSYFWRQSSLGTRFQQELRNKTIAISSSAQSYCWFISAKKQFRWRYAPVEIGRLARCILWSKKTSILMWDFIHGFLP